MWLFSHPFKSLPPDPQGASCWCPIPKKSPWDVLGPLLPPLLGCVIQEELRPVWWATLINIPPFSPISSSTRMMDFLLSELHGLIKRNPRRKQIFFPPFPSRFRLRRKAQYILAGKAEMRNFGDVSLQNLLRNRVRTSHPRDDYFFCSPAQKFLFAVPRILKLPGVRWSGDGNEKGTAGKPRPHTHRALLQPWNICFTAQPQCLSRGFLQEKPPCPRFCQNWIGNFI